MRTRSMTATITAMSLAGALSVSAHSQSTPQTPTGSQPTTPTRTEPQTPRAGSEQTVSVTGCLTQDTAAPGAAGAAGAAATAGATRTTGAPTFALSNARMSKESSTSALGNMSRVSLTGMADAELQKHLNHQVEITGHLMENKMSGTAGTTAPPAAAGTEARAGIDTSAMASMPLLHATSLKMIASTCPEK
jgi:hypothetical protein